MFLVDTNVFLYAVNENAAEHGRCRKLLERWRASPVPWFTTWGILYEFLRVSTHPRVFEEPLTPAQAWSFVSALCASSMRVLVATERHFEIAEALLAEVKDVRGNLFHDFETLVLMREHGLDTLYTRDRDFQRFPGLRILDPLA